MRYILLFVVLFSFFQTSFAEEDFIDASISQKQVTVGENFQLQVQIDASAFQNTDIQIEIPGVENFKLFSQSQGYNYANLNGETQSKINYTLDFTAPNVGVFSLGPIKIVGGDSEITDNETFSIEVQDSLLHQIISPGSIAENISPKKENLDNGQGNIVSKTEDIRPIRPWKPSILGIIGVLGIFFVLFYSFLEYILFPKIEEQKKKKKEKNIEKPENFNQEMLKYFEKLLTKAKEMENEKFFRKYNEGIRKIFVHKGFLDAMSATLKELQKQEIVQDQVLLKIFKKSYEHEYSGKNKTFATRKKYIDMIIELL